LRQAIERAVRHYLEGTNDMTLVLRQLAALHRNIDRSRQEGDARGQFAAEHVQMWLHNTPPLPPGSQQLISRQANASYQQLLARTGAAISSGRTFIDALPKDSFSPLPVDEEHDSSTKALPSHAFGAAEVLQGQ
jgi:hypothetical protein